MLPPPTKPMHRWPSWLMPGRYHARREPAELGGRAAVHGCMRWLVVAFAVGCGTAPAPPPVRSATPAAKPVAPSPPPAVDSVVVPEAEPEPVEVPAAANPVPPPPPVAR